MIGREHRYKISMGASPGSLARNQHRGSDDQQDFVDSAGQFGQAAAIWMYSFEGMDLQLFSLNF